MRTREHHDKLVEALLECGTSILPAYYKPDSCIAASLIVCDVLARFGYASRVLPVRGAIFNAAWIEQADAQKTLPVSREDLEEWHRAYGAYAMGIGRKPDGSASGDPFKWAGHLVALTEYQMLVDLTLTQCDRPQEQIALRPVGLRLPRGWPEEGKPRVSTMVNGCLMFYEPDPTNLEYIGAPAFGPTRNRTAATGAILEHLAVAHGLTAKGVKVGL